MDCAHLPAIHPHSKLRGILAFSRDNNTGPTHHQAVANPWRECTTQLTGQYIALVVRCQSEGVRCPGDTIQFMAFGYDEYVRRVRELAGLDERESWELYESWTPYRL
jgi:hypothetical protein